MNLNHVFPLVAILIAGCGTSLPRYEKPRSEMTARLRYAVGMQQGSLYMFDDKNCSKNGVKAAHLRSDFGAAIHGINNKSIGMPDPESTGKRLFGEMMIDADKPLYFAVFGADEGYGRVSTCEGFVGFHPKKGHDYEISLDRTFSVCRVQIAELTHSNGGVYSRLPVEALPTSKNDCPAAYDSTGGFR